MATLHLVDGTYELFRAHFSMPSRTAPDGAEVGALEGLSASLLALLREEDVTHVACAFDHVVESFRNDLFDGYKTGEGIEPALRAQFPWAEEAAAALGVVVWPMIEFEADDALATAARAYRGAFDRIVLASPDKDLAQCVVDDVVVMWDRRRKITYDADGVREKHGVAPVSIPDYLALVGDAADGIPGLPGWGAKGTAAVLGAYGSLERIPDDADQWSVKPRGAARLASVLAARREDVRLYKKLATLRTDVPLAEDAADLAWRGVPRVAWEAFCGRWGLERLSGRPHRWRSDA